MSEQELDQEQEQIDTTQAAQIANIEGMIGEDFNPDAEKPEPKKKAQAVAPIEVDPDIAVFISSVASAGFSAVASFKGAHWAIDQENSDAIGTSGARVLEKYFPRFDTGPEAALLFSIFAIVVPRVVIDLKLKGLPLETEQDSEKAETGDGVQPESGAA